MTNKITWFHGFISALFVFFCGYNAFSAVSVKVFMKDNTLADSAKASPFIYIKNTGTDTLKNFYFYYYFTTEQGNAAVYGTYYIPNTTVTLEKIDSTNYRLKFFISGWPLKPNDSLFDEQFAVYYDYVKKVDKTNDYSYMANASFLEDTKIPVFLVSNDSLIYGTTPNTPVKPTAKISGVPTSGKDSLKVQFIDSSTGTITSRLWNFGDNTTDTSAHPLHNYTKPGSFPVKLVVIGPGGKDSLTVPNYIVITATADTNRPINPIILTATAQSDSSILLFWNKTSGFDSLRIWKGSFAIPPLTVAPGNGYETIAIGLTDTTKLLTGLSPVTSYFFGAQVFGNGLWSIITDKSTASAKTLETADTATVVNTIQITKILFDGLTNSIKVFWTKDSAQSLNYTIGISFSAAGYPADTNAPKRIVPGNLPTDSATIALGASILFDTVYYGALWLKKGAGPWSTPITTSIAVPSFTWQEIVYFKANGARDTSYAFNKRIRLSNDVAGDPIKDTLIAWFPLDAVTNGFIPVSVGFYFKRKNPSPSFFIGLRCDSIPKRYSADSVRIYRYDNGAWLVEANSACDPVTDFVSVKTRDLEKPFIAMIDTVRPAYTHLGTLEPIIAGRPIADTFVVNDNVSNMRCSFRYAKGANSYAEGDSNDTVLTLKMDTVVNTIQGSTVSEDNGVRALFIISDGVHTDTMNISRQTIRTQRSDAFMAGAMQWMPLHATALPETSDIRHALRNFSVKGAWSYDPSAFRLFRWYPSAQNAQTTDKYIEYSDSIRNIFSISPGNILWLKSRKQVQVDFGSATTPLLTAPYGIITQPGEWTDIALPFKFDIFIGDVLASTRGAGQAADSLEWYRWTLDTKSHYFADPVYVPGLGDAAPQLTDESYEIVSKETVGYTVRNTSHESTKILFPPLPPSMSSFAKPLVKKSIRGNWALTIRGRVAGGETLSPVYCGFMAERRKNPSFFSAPPSMGAVAIRVCDNRQNHFGHQLAYAASGETAATFNLAFINYSEASETIEYSIENADRLPKGIFYLMLDPETGNGESTGKSLQVTVAAGHCAYRKLAVGSKEYCAKIKHDVRVWKLDLLGAYPNPCGKLLRIQYSLPETGIDHIKLSIVSVFGRQVFETIQRCGSASGVREAVWDGSVGRDKPIASGVYVVRLTAFDGKSRRAGVFEKKITFLP